MAARSEGHHAGEVLDHTRCLAREQEHAFTSLQIHFNFWPFISPDNSKPASTLLILALLTLIDTWAALDAGKVYMDVGSFSIYFILRRSSSGHLLQCDLHNNMYVNFMTVVIMFNFECSLCFPPFMSH